MAEESLNYLNSDVIQQAQQLSENGDVMGAWQLLADNGDSYADNAAVVTGGYQTPEDRAYFEMVKNHWENTTGGSEAYEEKFDKVAQQHLDNYLEILEGGKAPTTNQIVDSYVESLKENGLPATTAFDAYYEAVRGDATWASMLDIDPARIDAEIIDRPEVDDSLSILLNDVNETISDLWDIGGFEYTTAANFALFKDALKALEASQYISAEVRVGLNNYIDSLADNIGIPSFKQLENVSKLLDAIKDFEQGKWEEGTGGQDEIIEGTKGDDVIEGNKGDFDVLEGGEGFDTYLAEDGNVISDSDQQGLVQFNGQDISGNKYVNPETGLYEDDSFTFAQQGSDLIVTDKNTGESITVENWDKDGEGLGIKFFKENLSISVSDARPASEGDLSLRYFVIEFSRPLVKYEELTLEIKTLGLFDDRYRKDDNGNLIRIHYNWDNDEDLVNEWTYAEGAKSQSWYITWDYDDDVPEADQEVMFTVDMVKFVGDDEIKVTVENFGTATIYDNDQNKRYDPVVLDINKDGKISVIPLEESNVYFDITGDGIRERVGWVQGEDGVLVFDKNANGQIDGVNELFGNQDVNGFDELRRIADSNYDNVIDRKDELYNQLQVWQDFNQDGKVQDGELSSLQEVDIQTIELDYVATEIDLDGNLLTEASKYSDSDGNRELVADIQLNTDAKDTQLDPDDIPDFTVDESTYNLPQFKGSGLVLDSFIQYNLDAEFKALTEVMSSDSITYATQFDSFLEHYSGFKGYEDELKERFSLDDVPIFTELEKQALILERFNADDTYTNDIKAYYNQKLNGDSVDKPTYKIEDDIAIQYQILANQMQSLFAFQSIFKEVIPTIQFDSEEGVLFVENQDLLESQLLNYLNNNSISIEERLYFTEALIMQSATLKVNPGDLVDALDDRVFKGLYGQVLRGREFDIMVDGELATQSSGQVLIGSESNDVVHNSRVDDVLLGLGDDRVYTGKDANTFYYRRGDGSDVIGDSGGLDKLVFGEGINREDVSIRLVRNTDLIIALNEEGKSFEELSDRVIMVDWMRPDNRIEEIEFADGSMLRLQEVFDQFVTSDEIEVVELGWGNDVIDGQGGDDVIVAGKGNDKLTGSEGNDRLEGGDGNDTYYYDRGDGRDTIIDRQGYDVLQFASGIILDDLTLEYQGQDLVIALKEDNKTVEQLNDVITIKNYKNNSSKIESIYLEGYRRVNIEEIINQPTDDDDIIVATDGNLVVDLLAGNDHITANDSANYVYGNLGDDIIYTKDGNDVLEGGQGADKLYGGQGNDTYIFNRGDGQDIIFDDYRFGYQGSQQENAGEDTLYLGQGITEEDVIVQQVDGDLILGIKEDGVAFESLSDVVTIKNYINSNNRIEHIKLSDGTEIMLPEIGEATEGSDELLHDFELSDLTINALGGNDFIHSGHGNDLVLGGRGFDDLYASNGNDVLIGGDHNDLLFGGAGNDAYVFNIGDGADTILDDNRPGYVINPGAFNLELIESNIENSGVEQLDAGQDEIRFGKGISSEDLAYQRIENDLIIAVGDRGDQITIKNHFDELNSIEKAVFSDGSEIELPRDEKPFVHTYSWGDGDYIIANSSNVDSIVFGDSVSVSDLFYDEVGDDIVLRHKAEDAGNYYLGQSVTIKDYLSSESRIELLNFADGGSISIASLSVPTSGNDVLVLEDNHTHTNLLEGDDYIYLRGNVNKTVYANTGDDQIVVEGGNNLLSGGLGNDLLTGGNGDDTYLFERGDGRDVITDNGGLDRILFGSGINSTHLVAKLIQNDFVIAIREEGKTFEELSDTITIKNFINGNSQRVSSIEFEDGQILDTIDLMVATLGDDFIKQGNKPVDIDLLDGNDVIFSSSDDDIINGGAGNDEIFSGAGADHLSGGLGSDKLFGGYGNDTYYFNNGDGHDTILDDAGTDKVVFGTGISYESLTFKIVKSDLIVAIKEDGKSFDELSNKITINNWFNQKSNIESFEFSDGFSITAQTLAEFLLNALPDTLHSKNGAEMRGGIGDDTYVYKKGDFTVIIDDDVYNGDLQVNTGNDVLEFTDITSEQVELGISGQDLIIKIDAGSDSYQQLKDYVVIRDWRNENRGIESISFANGEFWSIDKEANFPSLIFDESWISSRYYIYGAENNIIEGSDFAETIESGSGNDNVTALDGNDRLVGQQGNDFLDGGSGNDMYVFTRGDGQDIVIDSSGVDTLVFNGGITFDDIVFEQVGNDLVVGLNEDGKSFTDLSDKVTLTEWFTGIEGRVEYLALDGQDIISIADLIIEPTEQDDSLEYGDENNHIDALAGDDVIHIGGGDDVLAGNDGDDQLFAGSGDDIVSGDAGTDVLYGAEGDDTYLFGRGDGQDTVIEDNFDDWGTTGFDTLKFKEGISPDDIILVQKSDDLIVGLAEEGKAFAELSDKITLKKWSTYDQENSRDYSRAYYAVEQFSFADGSSWNMSQIISHINTNGDDVIYGFNSDDILVGTSGNDELYGRLGDDTYVFNRGDGHDVIYDYGQKENDTSFYDAGNDTLQFGEGIGADDLVFAIQENKKDLLIYIKEEGKDLSELTDTVLIKEWSVSNNRVENFMLRDGTVLDISQYFTPVPTEFNDILIYSNDSNYVDALSGDDIVYAQGGDDTVLGNKGNDELQGGSGEDSLIGGEGDDTLSGGVDNDYLEGGVGSDRYIFNLGDGYDVISDFSEDLNDSDVIRFGEGIDSGSVIFSQDENDLVIAISSEDRLTVQNWYANNEYRIETIEFYDGTSLSTEEVEQIVQLSQNHAPVIVSDVPEKLATENLYASNSQITELSDGGFVIGWNEYGYAYYGEVSSQIFDSSGEKVGTEINVNTYREDSQYIQDMVTLTSGDYVSVWVSYYQDGNSYGVYLQQFTSNGTKVGEEIQVNTFSDDIQFSPVITPLTDGGYVVAWVSGGQDGSFDGVFLQKFTADGQKFGSETQVNTYIDNHQDSPVITSLNGGGYVVGWNSYAQDGSGSGAYMQVFDSSGNKVGAEQRVHTDTDDNQYIGEFVGLSDGGFAVTFIGADGGTKHFHVRKYDQDGLLVGQEQNFDYVVNIYTSKPKVIPLEDGGFISAWVAINDDGSSEGVYLQRHDSQAEKVGEEHRVNNMDNYSLNIVDVTLLDGGEYVIAWESSDGYYGGTSDIFTQRFDGELKELGYEQKVNFLNGAITDSIDMTGLGDGGYALSFTDDGGIYYQQFDALGNKVGQEVSPQTDFILWSGETLSGNFDYIHDPDGDTLSFSWDLATEVDSVLDGDFSLNQDGSWSYIAGSNYDFYDEFTITVNDGHGGVLKHTLTFDAEIRTLTDPIVLDLNDNGITSVSIEESNAYFDYDGDGKREHTAWMERGDAQLVADINFDGKISDGTEVFGEYTLLPDGSKALNGYEALGQYDSNGDRVIDNQDVLFGNLSLWQDYNQNGKTEAGELTNIQLSEVTAIHLDQESGITFEQRQENGNTLLNETNYVGLDGNGITRNIGFVYNALDTITNNDTLSTKFYGQLLSGEDGDDTYVFNSGDGVVTINDNGDGSDRLVFGENITPEQLIVRWDKTNNGLIIGVKESADDASSIYDVTDKIAIHDWFEDSGTIEMFEFADGSVLSRESLYEQYTSLAESQGLNARVLDTNGELAGGDFADVLYGAEGEEKLEGLAGNDYLRGLSGDDYLLAGSGNDTLEGGLGDDTLYSESGNDYYLYSRGDGKDLIQDFSGYDRLVFGEGITQEDVIIEQDGYDLLIGLTEEGKSISELSDLIRIEGQFIAGFQIEQIELYSGELIQLNHNDAPDINSVAASLLEDESFSAQLSVNGNVNGLIYEVESSSEFANFSIDENGQYTYTPNEHFNGQDSVTVKVTNAKGQTDTEVLSFDVESVNDAPTVNNSVESILLQNIRSQNGVVSVTDVDGDALSYSVTTQALNGSLTIDTEGQWHYQADDLYIGQDSAVVTVDDGQGGLVTQTLNFDVGVSTPVFDDNEVMLLEDSQASGAFNVVNPVGGDLSYELVSSSANGELTLDSVGNWEYTPNDNYNGSDSISIKVTNEYGLSATSTLNFNIESVNDAPVLDNDQETVLLQDVRSSQGKVNAFDVEGDLLSYVVTEQAVNGVVTLDSEGNWNYQANALYLGQDYAVITVNDGLGGTVTKTLNFDISVSSPSLTDSSIVLEEDGTTDGVFNVINPIGGELTFELVSGSAHGELMLDNSGYWNYTPSADYNGEDAVTIKVTNEYGLSSSSNISFSIEAVNDAPIVTTESESFTLTNIRDVDGRIEASDVDGDSLLYSVQGSPENGSLVIDENGYWSYRADASFNGDDSAVIMVDDGNGGNVTTTLNFKVEGYQYEGQDLIINDNSGGDTLVMNGVEKRDLQFSRQGDALSIQVRDEATVTLSNYFVDVLSGVEEIITDQGIISLAKDVITQMTPWDWWTFGDDGVSNLIDGSSYSDWIFGGNKSDVLLGSSGPDGISGFDGNDTIIGGNGSDLIYGDSGDDNLYGGNQADYLYGGQGSDTLIGGSGDDELNAQNGNDLLVGGRGQDILKGGNGDDVYSFSKGDGIDLIRDTGGLDTIQFGEGVGKEDISFFMKNRNFYLQYSDTDYITVSNQARDNNKIERIELNDGRYMTNSDIDLIVQQMSAFASEKGIWKPDNNDIRNNEQMMQIITSGWH